MRLRAFSAVILAAGAILALSVAGQSTDTPEIGGLSRAQNVVNLLKLVETSKDALEGRWLIKDEVLIADQGAVAKLNLPYEPPPEYDCHIEFSREEGNGPVIFILAAKGKQFLFEIGGAGNTTAGFAMVNGAVADHNKTTVRAKSMLDNGKRYDLTVKVRNEGMEAYVNGKLLSKWKTDHSDMSLWPGWRIRDAKALGIASDKNTTKFFKIEVTEVSGNGQVVAHNTGTPARAPGNGPPSPTTPVARGPKPAPGEKIAIDFSVACAQPDPNTPPLKAATSADPNAIERPDYTNRPKALVKTLSTATAMMVQSGENGDMMGLTSDIIATVDPDSRRSNQAGIGILRADGDDTMRTALEEAVRAVKLRYPIWEPGHIDLSFGEKFVTHGGPSAGTAFALLMLSELEGFDLDPKCAITGDITVDWKVRAVGGVTAKLHGATLDKCLYAAIPVDNETAFADMALLYGDSALWDLQVFSIATLQDAQAIARKDRPEKLAEAIKLFAELQPNLTQGGPLTLQEPATQKTLEKILEMAPNHLSAKFLLAIAQGKAARTLSANATFYRLEVVMYPFGILLARDQMLNRQTLPATTTIAARKALTALRRIANKDFFPLLVDESAFIEAMDAFAGRPNESSLEALRTRFGALRARFAELAGDKDLLERLQREGY